VRIMNIRILVADDDPDIVLSLSERLRWMGHEVITAGDGHAALSAVESHSLDLALIDVSMPQLSGIEVLKRIRQRWPNLPVVILTAYGTIRLAVEAMKEGAVDFIAKPFEHGQIDQVVTTVLGRSEQRADITRLMGEVTHDVKNLLMPLVTGTDLLAEEIDDLFKNLPAAESVQAEESHHVCEEVIQLLRNTSRRIQDRMKGIADYAAVSRASQNFESCRIAKIAENVMKSLRVLAEQKHITVGIEGLGNLPDIVGDEARLYSLLYNLVNNAIPEVPPLGSITICGRHRADDDFIELAVQDTGNGMPPEIRDSLFTNRLVSRKAGGTGLGTKIVKDVVDMHGGQIAVESQEGKGTTFVIRLPIRPLIPMQNWEKRPSEASIRLS
jgi:signal transduction histidine kinase